MLHSINQLAANFIHLLFGAVQVVHSRFIRASRSCFEVQAESVQLLSSTLALFMSAHINASVALSDQYLSSQAVISDHDQMHLMAITLLLLCSFPLFLCCRPFCFSLCVTCFFSPILSVFVSHSSSIIMFHTLLIALPPWPHILAGHTAFLLTLAITLERSGVSVCVCVCRNRLAQLHHD